MAAYVYRPPAPVTIDTGATIPQSPSPDAAPSRGIESVSRALDLLEALADSELGLVELGRATGLRPSTTHRMLATLSSRGYVRRTEENRYTFGYRALRLADAIERDTSELRRAVLPFLLRVHRVADAPTSLLVLSGVHAVYLEHLNAEDRDASAVHPGERIPLHASAAGKAMLAHRPAAADSLLAGRTLERFTALTVVHPEPLRRELARVRRQGFAIAREEHRTRRSSVAAPLFDASGTAFAALDVTAATSALSRLAPWDELGELVRSTALDASRALGYPG